MKSIRFALVLCVMPDLFSFVVNAFVNVPGDSCRKKQQDNGSTVLCKT